ncbi:MAG: cell division protein FtsH, partial [Coriobacteriales bacterium]
SIPDEDTFLQTRDQMIDSLAMLLGGRVAEEIANDGNITTGASNDLQRATATARDMVMKFGMSEKLGAFVYGASGPLMSKDYSPETASVIDEEARRLVQNAHDTAYRLLTGQRKLLDQMAEVLIERETIDGPAVEALLAGNWEQYLKEEHDDEVTRKREENKRRQRLAAAKQKRDSEGGEDDQSRDIVDDLVKDGSAKPAF